MLFYEKITICNIFAYYGVQSVEFEQKDGKNLYLIYGNNGYSKTSFIRSMKILFLGSGLNDLAGNTPENIANFAYYRITPQRLIKGDDSWLGILNKAAVNENKNEFFVELVLQENNKEITIKREWRLYPNLNETLSFKIDAKEYTGNQAQERVNQILPSEFVEFFLFDGEEIEKMAEKISTSLKDKIQNILNIKPIDRLIKQARKLKDSYVQESIKDEKLQNNLEKLKSDILDFERNKEINDRQIAEINENLQNLQDDLESVTNKRDGIIKNSGEEEAKLQEKKSNLNKQMEDFKQNFIKNAPEIMFLGLDDFYQLLQSRIRENLQSNSIQNIKNLNLIKNKLGGELSDKITSKYKEFKLDKYELRDLIIRSIDEIADDSFGKNSFKGVDLNGVAKSINFGLNKASDLSNTIISIKNTMNDLENTKNELNLIIGDSDIKEEMERIKIEIKKITDERDQQIGEKTILTNEQRRIQENIDKTNIEILKLENNVAKDSRLKKQAQKTKNIINQLIEYKEKCIAKMLKELKISVLANYKRLIGDDNVENIDITNEFEIILKAKDGSLITVKNQSAGQKQATAISIFWALSQLSQRELPLIIDTPLSRMDSKNTKNIITSYYFDASKQIIVLPHSVREFGKSEFEVSKDKIAQSFVINNDDSRAHARIMEKDITKILGE
ncbi:MAG: AAA family ATPase [Campylobacter sp.]|nr:AAA family ATPase [Campylobacter sp.]